MLYRILALLILLFVAAGADAQVQEIKKGSSSRSRESSVSAGGSGGGSFLGDVFFHFMIGNVVHLQQQSLARRSDVPYIVSFDLALQGATQAAGYYIVHPRARANWGIFSTDFRFNYVIEEELDGTAMLRTNDWQIVQVNLLNHRDVNLRVGGGVIYEAFGAHNNYGEWTAAIAVHPWEKKVGGQLEYRGSEARNEINGHVRYNLFEQGRLHGYATFGAVFQRYYGTVDVWGFQGGLLFSVY